jgi:cytochrome c biogenesis factor
VSCSRNSKELERIGSCTWKTNNISLSVFLLSFVIIVTYAYLSPFFCQRVTCFFLRILHNFFIRSFLHYLLVLLTHRNVKISVKIISNSSLSRCMQITEIIVVQKSAKQQEYIYSGHP